MIDHVYDGFRSAFGFVSSGLTKLVTGREPKDGKVAKLEARVKELEKIVGEIVACQPSDPLGDLARAEAHFESSRKMKRSEPEDERR